MSILDRSLVALRPLSPSCRPDFDDEALPWMPDVRRYAWAMTRDEFEAEDVVQETYLRAFRSWHTFVAGSDCRRWLFTICRNAFLRTRERTHPTLSLDGTDRRALEAVPLPLTQPARDDCAADELRTAIARALATLPEPYRSTVLIVDVRDQPYEVAARLLGVPVGTIRSRLFRGRRMLQSCLAAHAADAGLVA